MSIYLYFFMRKYILFLLVKFQEGNYCHISMCLTMSESIRLFLKWLYHFTFSPAVFESFSCSLLLPTLPFVIIFSISGGWVTMSHVTLICISMKAKFCWVLVLTCINMHLLYVFCDQIFNSSFIRLLILLSEFFIQSYKKSFVRQVFCKYFHLVSGLPFHFYNGVS